MILGNVISNYRNKNQLTMDEFAKMTGLSKAYISMLEKNKNSSNGKPIIPSLPTLKRVAAAINISIDELLKILDNDQPIIIPADTDEIENDQIKQQELKNLSNSMVITNNREKKLIKKYRALDERGKSSVELMLNAQYESICATESNSENEVS